MAVTRRGLLVGRSWRTQSCCGSQTRAPEKPACGAQGCADSHKHQREQHHSAASDQNRDHLQCCGCHLLIEHRRSGQAERHSDCIENRAPAGRAALPRRPISQRNEQSDVLTSGAVRVVLRVRDENGAAWRGVSRPNHCLPLFRSASRPRAQQRERCRRPSFSTTDEPTLLRPRPSHPLEPAEPRPATWGRPAGLPYRRTAALPSRKNVTNPNPNNMPDQQRSRGPCGIQ